MAVSLIVLKEAANEPRVSATPDTVKKFTALGINVTVESGAGEASGFADADYQQAGATLTHAGGDGMQQADLVFGVCAPLPSHIQNMKSGAALFPASLARAGRE